MEAPRKRQKVSSEDDVSRTETEGETTDFKLAILSSLHPDRSQEVLLDYLLAYDGSVQAVSTALSAPSKDDENGRKRSAAAIGYQSSLSAFTTPTLSTEHNASPTKTAQKPKSLTKKGQTLHLYTPSEIALHSPCTIIHNFLPASEASALLDELINEAPTLTRSKFVLFGREVESPHSFRFYVNTHDEAEAQRTEYIYNGGSVPDVGRTPPVMLKVCGTVEDAVNEEIEKRIEGTYEGGKRLKFQSPDVWKPNASFVNCYDGGKESVGWHSDQLTYLGPRAVIGSLSLGVAREFRIRRVLAQEPDAPSSVADEQGQIAIHLPHNSLLVMHADMQEEWKHSIAPTQVIDPHPLAGNRRFNITYRCYKDYLHPKFTPRCRCDVPCVLRCMQKKAISRGRYFWQCHANYMPGKKGCGYFDWAEFDEDGKPPWADGFKGNANVPLVLDNAKPPGEE